VQNLCSQAVSGSEHEGSFSCVECAVEKMEDMGWSTTSYACEHVVNHNGYNMYSEHRDGKAFKVERPSSTSHVEGPDDESVEIVAESKKKAKCLFEVLGVKQKDATKHVERCTRRSKEATNSKFIEFEPLKMAEKDANPCKLTENPPLRDTLREAMLDEKVKQAHQFSQDHEVSKLRAVGGATFVCFLCEDKHRKKESFKGGAALKTHLEQARELHKTFYMQSLRRQYDDVMKTFHNFHDVRNHHKTCMISTSSTRRTWIAVTSGECLFCCK